jgi:hypothetical protein
VQDARGRETDCGRIRRDAGISYTLESMRRTSVSVWNVFRAEKSVKVESFEKSSRLVILLSESGKTVARDAVQACPPALTVSLFGGITRFSLAARGSRRNSILNA